MAFLVGFVVLSIFLGCTAGAREVGLPSERLRPIQTTPPSWLTDELLGEILEHNYAALPVDGRAEVAGVVAPGIHPSQWLQSITVGTGGIKSETCTGGFIFRRKGRYALGAAGHCAPLGATVTAYVRPPNTSGGPPGLYSIGRVILSSGSAAPAGSDFALIRIDKKFNSWVDPSMPFWGGPSGAYVDSAPSPVTYVGHGLATGAAGAPRAGYADLFERNVFSFVGLSGPGDSGGAVLTASGLAAGNQTHVYPPTSASSPGIVFGTRIGEMLRQASGWTLVTTS